MQLVVVSAFSRKASLNLIKKMVHYIQPSLLVEACSPESPTYNFGTMLVEVIATVLDNEVRNRCTLDMAEEKGEMPLSKVCGIK
jgi:hypothetical protein